MKSGLIALLMLVATASGSNDQARVSPQRLVGEHEDSDAYDVYAAVLNRRLPTDASEQLIIVNSTVRHEICALALQETDERIRAAIQSYKEANSASRKLQRKFPFQREYAFITQEEIKSTFNNGPERGWKIFNRKHPKAKGFVELSVVGFSDDRSVAVVYEGYHCGGLCGSGGIRVLEKKDGNWQYMQSSFFCDWIS